MPLTAMTGGSNQSLSTALVGDLSNERQRGKRLGMLYTVGDLASAVGPPLAYGIISWVGLDVVYWLCAALLGAMALVSLRWTAAR
ncbi:MAG: MFS transporter [Chloroflexi bacterium]|nr:MAG: MFS transporter [Chloroflexota bacterium]